jgi:hypothetical protein
MIQVLSIGHGYLPVCPSARRAASPYRFDNLVFGEVEKICNEFNESFGSLSFERAGDPF